MARSEESRKRSSEAARVWWQARKEAGMNFHTEETKRRMSAARTGNHRGYQAVLDRITRLEDRLRGFGYSEHEIRNI